jgi:hypothetical protein
MTTPADDDTPRKPGRPSDYTDEIAAHVCEFLAEGKSLRWICEQDGMPSRSSVLRWLRANANFQAAYRVAREYGAETLADEIVDLATQPMRSEDAPVARFRLDAIKWAPSKLSPRRWGDKIQAELSGPGGAPLQLQPVPAPAPMVPAEVAAGARTLVRALLAEAEAAAGLPDGEAESLPDAVRLQRLLAGDEPLAPTLYAVVHSEERWLMPAATSIPSRR